MGGAEGRRGGSTVAGNNDVCGDPVHGVIKSGEGLAPGHCTTDAGTGKVTC